MGNEEISRLLSKFPTVKEVKEREEMEQQTKEHNYILEHGKIVAETQRQRVDKDGYIITENLVTVSDGRGNSESFKEPKPTFNLFGKTFFNPEYEKYQRLRKD